MRKIKYELMYVGKIHKIDTYASITECPFDGTIGPRHVGSQACAACKYHESMDDTHVLCNNPKELKWQ